MDEEQEKLTGLRRAWQGVERVGRGIEDIIAAQAYLEDPKVLRIVVDEMLKQSRKEIEYEIVLSLESKTEAALAEIGTLPLEAIRQAFIRAGFSERRRLQLMDTGIKEIVAGFKQILHPKTFP